MPSLLNLVEDAFEISKADVQLLALLKNSPTDDIIAAGIIALKNNSIIQNSALDILNHCALLCTKQESPEQAYAEIKKISPFYKQEFRNALEKPFLENIYQYVHDVDKQHLQKGFQKVIMQVSQENYELYQDNLNVKKALLEKNEIIHGLNLQLEKTQKNYKNDAVSRYSLIAKIEQLTSQTEILSNENKVLKDKVNRQQLDIARLLPPPTQLDTQVPQALFIKPLSTKKADKKEPNKERLSTPVV
jgi:RecG-like helicase